MTAGTIALVCAALVMLVLSPVLRHGAHAGLGHDSHHHGAVSVSGERMAAFDPSDESGADTLYEGLHGHAADHTDHDHSTPFLSSLAATYPDFGRPQTGRFVTSYLSRQPNLPKPPPRR